MSDATLLVIDDEPAVLEVVGRFAQPFGFKVVGRTNARAALAELPQLKPDVAIVDLRMPEMNGLDVLRAIHAIDPTCQVVLMTGDLSVDSAIEAVKLGALDYIGKPFDRARLGALLTGVCKGIERRQKLLQVDGDLGKSFTFYGMIGRSPPCKSSSTRSGASLRTCAPCWSRARRGQAKNSWRVRCTRLAPALTGDS